MEGFDTDNMCDMLGFRCFDVFCTRTIEKRYKLRAAENEIERHNRNE